MKKILCLLSMLLIVSGCVTTGPTVSKSDMGNLELNVFTQGKEIDARFAEVYVDSTFLGNLSPSKPILNLKEGEHVIRIELKGYKSYEKKMFISGDPNHQVLNVLLEKE